jgi:hypothetical protein
MDKATGNMHPRNGHCEWMDITTERGHKRFMAVVIAVKQMVAAL